jgi:CspA family cold shock protein
MSSYGFEEADSHEESVRISGRVKWFDAGKGYGFIVPDDPSQTGLRDVLLHVTSLRNCGRESAAEGSIIICEVVKRPKGWQVHEVVELDESAAPPPSERPQRQFDRDGGGFRRDRDSGDRHAAGGFRDRAPRRPPAVRWSGPRSNGSIAPKATALWFAMASPVISSSISRPCGAAALRTFSRARM